MNRTVLFAGGPLHGQVRVVEDARSYAVPVLCDPSADPLDFSADVMMRREIYNIGKFVLCGHMIWIGHLGTEPDDSLVFEVITSEGARAASLAVPAERLV